MKKFISGIVAGVILTTGISTFASTNTIRLIINGNDITDKMDVKPQLIDGRTLVPAKYVAEELGATVEWDDVNKAVIINSEKKEDTSIKTDNKDATNLNTNIVPPRIDVVCPEVTMTINNVTLKGILYEGKEYYNSDKMCKAVTNLSRISDELSGYIFHEKIGDNVTDIKTIYTLSFSEPCFVRYNGTLYMEREYFEQNIMPLYQ